MFKRLKQRIGQEGSPTAAETADYTQPITYEREERNRSLREIENDIEPTAVHSHNLLSSSSDTAQPYLNGSKLNESLTRYSPNHIDGELGIDQPDEASVATTSAVLLQTEESPSKDVYSPIHLDDSHETVNLPESSSRRKNLAATVLKYGEEISAKNRQIVELETKLMTKMSDERERIARLEESLSSSKSTINCLNEKISDQEETITQLVVNMSKLEETATCDKSVAVDLESKVAEGQQEVSGLLENLEACKLKEAASEETIKLLQSQIEHLKEQVENSKKDNFKFAPLSSSDFVSDTGDSQMTELKVKLSRSHSHSKRLELQLTDKEAQVATLVRENKDMRANLENSKQQAVNELLSVSEEESGLRSELSALVQKHNSLQSQYKSQSRLLLEKQKDMIQLEEKLQNSTDVNNKKRQQIVDQYAKQIAELERMNEALKLSLATETQAGVKLREKLDVVREEALDKQLDDEKQLSDLHEQLSSLRSEIWQLERSKKLATDRFNTELSARENRCSKLEELMATAQAESEAARASLTLQLTELNSRFDTLVTCKEELTQSLTDVESKLETTEAERDDLYLRNADLSSKLETCKIELKLALSNVEQERDSLQERLNYSEVEKKCLEEKEEALKEKVVLLEEHSRLADGAHADAEEKAAEIANLKIKLMEQDKVIGEKTKSIRVHQQTINDLKKTIKRELKDLGEPAATLGSGRSQELIDRVRSSPALSELERCESPMGDNIPSAKTKPQAMDESTAKYSTVLSQQYRHEVNGFCGHKDINFEYLKNVVFSFLLSRDSESMHLVKALAVLLEFTPAEEKLLKETVEWKMSWWPSSKKPTKKFRK